MVLFIKSYILEGLVGWSRRNILVPVPRVGDISALNDILRDCCFKYENHTIKGKPAKVGEMYATERPMLHALPGFKFETAKSANVRVNSFSTVKFRTNNYSVPVNYAGLLITPCRCFYINTLL